MGVNPVRFSKTALPAFVSLCFVLYLFTNRAPMISFISELKSDSLTALIFSSQYLEMTLVIISYAVSAALFAFSNKLIERKS